MHSMTNPLRVCIYKESCGIRPTNDKMQVEDAIKKFENLNFSVDGFSPKLNNILRNIIAKEEYTSFYIDTEIIRSKGDHFLSDIHEIHVTGETADGNKETSIFLKNIPNDFSIDTVSITRAFENEALAYNELHTIFVDLQNEAKIPTSEQFLMVKSYDGTDYDTIILENITKRGYKILPRMEVISIDVAEMAVKQIAKFHSLSFVIREKRPVYYDTRIKKIKIPFKFGEEWQRFIQAMYNNAIHYFNDDLKENLQETIMKLLKKYSVFLQDKSSICCLCHGDYRPSNIMVREHNGEVVDIIPIDYQLLNFGNPIYDFLFFIYTSTDKKFRKTHMEHLKDLYYGTMAEFLHCFQINVESVWSKQEFENIFNQGLDCGLIVVFLFVPFMFLHEEHVPVITKDLWSSMSFKFDERYKTKLFEAIEEFTEWGYLKTF